MSWHASVSEVSLDAIETSLREALDAQLGDNPAWADDVGTQQNYAITQAYTMARDTDLGDGPFNVSIHGHRGDTHNELGVTVKSPVRP